MILTRTCGDIGDPRGLGSRCHRQCAGRGQADLLSIQETGGSGHSPNFLGHRPTEWRRPKLHDPVLVRRVDGHRETNSLIFPVLWGP